MKTPGQIAYETRMKGIEDHHAKWEEMPDMNKVIWDEVANAVLNSQWRSVDDPPKNPYETVIVTGGITEANVMPFRAKNGDRTLWMPIPKLPKSKDREDFEKWIKYENVFGDRKDIAWKAWQAAKATK